MLTMILTLAPLQAAFHSMCLTASDCIPLACIAGCNALFNLLLGTKSGLVSKFLQIRACHSISLGKWTDTGEPWLQAPAELNHFHADNFRK